MPINFCETCGWTTDFPGRGYVRDPEAKWWQFWRTVVCSDCSGDGYARPKQGPPKPPPPPPPRRYPKIIVTFRKP